ncbi:MAG: DNA-processing protein DprA [Aeromicrobium sp.]|uniref:DNA-processing protein DprA n=1 Tax=Aeromicrobium sp. TaxID=1871063 RepID=UPI0039E64809
MSAESRDRLTLSLVAEPLDPRLRECVASHGVSATAAACRGEAGAPQVPAEWVRRAADLPVEDVVRAGDAAGARWTVPGDDDWPGALDDLDGVAEPGQRPWGLWVRGCGALEAGRAVSVVGARDCTTYGAQVAGDLGADLADRGWTVVSGAAFGIDACAHRGALAVAGRTVAVLACGVDVPYPRAHAALLERIAEEGGWILSEHPPGSTPFRHRFLTRNRIIAALGAGTVVVEAALRSGSLNTLRWSDRLGRLSMAVPGPVASAQSGGTHQAVRSGEAVLVTSAKDVAEELNGVGWADCDPSDVLTEAARRAYALLPQSGTGVSAGAMADLLGASQRTARSALILLERRGRAGRVGDGWLTR